jgi:hypothetical protein
MGGETAVRARREAVPDARRCDGVWRAPKHQVAQGRASNQSWIARLRFGRLKFAPFASALAPPMIRPGA